MQGRKKNRLQGFDYSNDAVYFITICTKNKINHFGQIHQEKMILNEFGKIAENQIFWLEKQYPYFELHNFVVMPNHIHLLYGINRDFATTDFVEIPVEFRTSHDLSQRNDDQIKIKSVSSLMGAYKTTVSKKIHEFGNVNFLWQRSFYDHIVRTEERYHQIKNYITTNPENWNKDKFYE